VLKLIDDSELTYEIGTFTSHVEKGLVQYWKDDEWGVARIVFNAPDRLNAMPVAGFRRVTELVRMAEADDDVKVIIFAGEGECLGVGADAAELGRYIGFGDDRSDVPGQLRRLRADREIIFGALGYEQTILNCLKVTVTEAHGYCYGAHFQLALASDIVLCTDDALFVHPAFRYLGPIANFALLMELIGLRKAKEMVLTGRPLTAEEAETYGFATKRVSTIQELAAVSEEYVRALSVQSMDGIAMGKSIIAATLDARAVALGETLGAVGHAWMTNQKFRPGEYNFVKSRRDRGITGAVGERDDIVPPEFRLGRERRGRSD
jgi:enoyl-CoA hydratase